jgi:hypothetical protein
MNAISIVGYVLFGLLLLAGVACDIHESMHGPRY